MTRPGISVWAMTCRWRSSLGEEDAMKKDAEVHLLLHQRQKGRTQVQAAARAGMSERTARKYEQAGVPPSQLKQPRTHRTRPDPFADDWAWIVGQLERDAALQAKTLFDLLCARHPGHHQAGQFPTLQRHIQQWPARLPPPPAAH